MHHNHDAGVFTPPLPIQQAGVKYKPYNSKRNSAASITSLQSVAGLSSSLTDGQGATALAPTVVPVIRHHRPSISDSMRANSAPATSSSPSAVGRNTASPVGGSSASLAAQRKIGIPTIVTPSPLAHQPSSPGNSSSGANTPTKRPINPACNSLDRFPSPNKNAFLPSVSPNGSSGLPTDYFHTTHSSLSSMIAGKQRTPHPPAPHPAGRAPYLAGFQPPGVYRIRTDELVKARRTKGETKKLESGRINRRLDKLVQLHFPNPSSAPEETSPTISRSTSANISLKDLANPRTVSAGDLWSSVRRSVQSPAARRAETVRATEQSIVHWQSDREAENCPLCGLPFSLTVRKHHCRLCGRVVCYVPPNTAPTPLGRTERCSTFIAYQWEADDDGWLIEMEDAVEEEVQSLREKQGVRVCKDCLGVVMHHQSTSKPAKQPLWLKLHDVLMGLQEQIDAALPALQEEILSSSATIASLTPAQRNKLLVARKKLLSLLASFDSLSKKIRDLPAESKASNSAQDRLQRAIANRATLYLQEKMGLLKGLGSFEDLPASQPEVVSIDVPVALKKKRLKREASGRTAEEQKRERLEIEERAATLTVLVEQEKLVMDYLAQANAKRQLVDAASLKASLEDLQREIAQEKDWLGFT